MIQCMDLNLNLVLKVLCLFQRKLGFLERDKLLETWLNIAVPFIFFINNFYSVCKIVILCPACHIYTDSFTVIILTEEIINILNSWFSCVLFALIPCITNK